MVLIRLINLSFRVLQNNKALKQRNARLLSYRRFRVLQNNKALKLSDYLEEIGEGFRVLQNNKALKHKT